MGCYRYTGQSVRAYNFNNTKNYIYLHSPYILHIIHFQMLTKQTDTKMKVLRVILTLIVTGISYYHYYIYSQSSPRPRPLPEVVVSLIIMQIRQTLLPPKKKNKHFKTSCHRQIYMVSHFHCQELRYKGKHRM